MQFRSIPRFCLGGHLFSNIVPWHVSWDDCHQQKDPQHWKRSLGRSRRRWIWRHNKGFWFNVAKAWASPLPVISLTRYSQHEYSVPHQQITWNDCNVLSFEYIQCLEKVCWKYDNYVKSVSIRSAKHIKTERVFSNKYFLAYFMAGQDFLKCGERLGEEEGHMMLQTICVSVHKPEA